MPPNLNSAIGLLLLLVLCWLTGKRESVPWRLVTGALVLQLFLALLLLKLPAAQQIFLVLNHALLAIEHATMDGTRLVFGYLGGGEPPFPVEDPANLFILGFRSLPLVLVISALSALLFYWRILPTVVRWVAIALRRSLGISGPLGVGSAANIFVGMVEAPLLIRPYLLNLHRGELFAVMVTGMATVAGTVLVLYGSLLASVIPNGLGHVMTASLMSAPAALMMAALYHP